MAKGSVRDRGLGTWQIRWEGPPTIDGKRQYRSETVHGKKADAEKVLRERMRVVDRGGYVKPSKETVGEFICRWLRDYAKPRLMARTLEEYEGKARLYLIPALGRLSLQDLRPGHVRALHADMLGRGLKPATVLHAHRLLSKVLTDAMKQEELIDRNVAQLVDPPSVRRAEMHTLDQHGVHTILGALSTQASTRWDQQMYAIVLLAIYSGLRRSEELGLRWGDVDLDGGTIHVQQTMKRLYGGRIIPEQPKTPKSRRWVALAPLAVETLRAHRTQSAAFGAERLVFCHFDGTPLDPNRVSRAFQRTAQRCGYKVRFHDLRHTYASIMLAAGVQSKIVQDQLGHSTIATTMDTYSHLLPGAQKQAALAFEAWLGQGAAEA